MHVRNMVVILAIICLVCCNNNYNSELVDRRMKSIIKLLEKDINKFSSKFELIEKNSDKFIVFKEDNEGLRKEKDFYTKNLIPDKKTAITFAKMLYEIKYPDKIQKFYPFFALEYENIWFVYGCKDIEKAITSNWEKIGEWDEIFVIIAKHNAEVYYMSNIIHFSD